MHEGGGLEQGRANEPRHEEQPITKEQLMRSFEKDSEEGKSYMLLNWRIQQLEKRRSLERPQEILAAYMETARTLRDIGLINDAREAYEDIEHLAETFEEHEVADTALAEMGQLPTVQ